jgi:hypothetical protein
MTNQEKRKESRMQLGSHLEPYCYDAISGKLTDADQYKVIREYLDYVNTSPSYEELNKFFEELEVKLLATGIIDHYYFGEGFDDEQ